MPIGVYERTEKHSYKCELGCQCKRHTNTGRYVRTEEDLLSRKGQVPWNKGKTDVYSEEAKDQMGNAAKGRPSIFKGMTNRWSSEQLSNLSQQSKNHFSSPDNRAKQSAMMTAVYKRPGQRQKARFVQLNRSAGSFKKVVSYNSRKGPNNLEKRFTELTGIAFVGDGKIVIGGKWPDFVVQGQRRVVEVYGCYWHDCPTCNENSEFVTPDPRVLHFQRHGYDCLVVWEHEVHQDPQLVKQRVREYVA